MADQPARKKDDPTLSLSGVEPGSLEYQHKMRLLREEEERKKNAVVREQWIETHGDSHHPKGVKCVLKKRMKNGNVHSLYLGRYLRGGKDLIAKYAEKGIKRREARLN